MMRLHFAILFEIADSFCSGVLFPSLMCANELLASNNKSVNEVGRKVNDQFEHLEQN